MSPLPGGHALLEHADPWGDELVDVESLNAPASDAILRAIDNIRDGAQRGSVPRAQSILVLGPAGAGKTHLFSRLRRKAARRTAFVLLRPELAIDASPRHVLAACLDALQRPVPEREAKQVDLVVGSAIALAHGRGPQWPLSSLEQLQNAPPDQRGDLIETVIEAVVRLAPDIEESWLERLLKLPVQTGADRRAALAWLSGREPDQAQLQRLGLTQALADASVLPALRTLAAIASYSTPLVLVFDQLENLVDELAGDGRIHAHARVVAELFDTVPGLALVQMALDAEWQRRIRPALSEAERSRLEARVETLSLPTPDQRTELVGAWLARLPPEQRRPLPWPFGELAWRQWRDQPGATPRMLLVAFRDALERGGPDEAAEAALAAAADAEATSVERADRLAELWSERVAAGLRFLHDVHSFGRGLDSGPIASGLASAIHLIEGVRVDAPGPRDAWDLRLVGPRGEVDVFVVQGAHHKSVADRLQKAVEAAQQRRVVALREASLAFPPTWFRVVERQEQLRAAPHATWLDIGHAAVVDLLAVRDLLSSARSQDLTTRDGQPLSEEEVHRWARETLQPGRWPVLSVLLGATPEGTREAPAELATEASAGAGARVASTAGATPTGAATPAAPSVQAPPDEMFAPAAPAAATGAAARAAAVAQAMSAHSEPPPASLALAIDADVHAAADGDALRRRVEELLRRQDVPRPKARTHVAARVVQLEVSVGRSFGARVDRAAPGVVHRLHADDGCAAAYAREGGQRVFTVARRHPRAVRLAPLLAERSEWLRARAGRFVLGEGVAGGVLGGDLADSASCHVLVGGARGSGKSTLLRAIASSLAHFHPPSALRLTMVDPAPAGREDPPAPSPHASFGALATTLTAHLQRPLCRDVAETLPILDALVAEMEARYRQFDTASVQDIDEYNELLAEGEPLARHVLIVDEFQDLVDAKYTRVPFLAAVQRLGAKARPCGIHLVLATHRLTKEHLPTAITSTLPGAIALRTASVGDSRLVLDQPGAERLLGGGDFLASLGHGLQRGQAPTD